MAQRKAISKRTRFEVFKRDSFTCQYCGKAAPDVILEVDHIVACAKGGSSDIINLITACNPCNAGKSAVSLSDDSVVKKRKRQTDELQARREQIEMMAEWQTSLVDLTDQTVRYCAGLWERIASPFFITETGLSDLRKLVIKFGVSEVMAAIRTSERYLDTDNDGKITRESAGNSLQKIGGICIVNRKAKEDPEIHEVYIIKAIISKNCPYIAPWKIFSDLKDLRSLHPIEVIKDRLQRVRSRSQYEDAVDELRSFQPDGELS